MSADALSDALRASQAKAVAALGRRYVRGEREPNPDEYLDQFAGMGLTDDISAKHLLASWLVLRIEGEQPPVEQAQRRVEPATDAQWARIRRDCDARSLVAPSGPLSKSAASEVIEAIAAGTYDPEKYDVPF
jgi:hypothetical protein